MGGFEANQQIECYSSNRLESNSDAQSAVTCKCCCISATLDVKIEEKVVFIEVAGVAQLERILHIVKVVVYINKFRSNPPL